MRVYDESRQVGNIKYKNERERIRHLAQQIFDQGGFDEKQMVRNARNMHYFPKTQEEYAQMRGFDGRITKGDDHG